MISVITPTYRTPPSVLARTWASLKAQTFTDWEWVVWDDSPNDDVWRRIAKRPSRKPATSVDTERALVANLSDWQVGKGEGDG